jgi:phosphate transport system substrate-binding protein
MCKYKFKSLFFLVIILIGCRNTTNVNNSSLLSDKNKSPLSGSFSVGGAYALYPLVRQWADNFMKINPGVKIQVTQNGTGQGINDLLAKKIQVAMISRPLNDEEINAGIFVIPVAKDGVAPIVNQKNPYLSRILNQGLSTDEFLKAFTSNKPVTWGELLDTNSREKAVVFIRADESGAADVWSDFIYRKSADLKGIKVTGDEEMIKSVRENPLALGFCNFSYAFDPVTGERVKDIQIIPCDLDFDNKIDRKEVPFINLEKAHRGLWLGYYPKNLCRELTLGSVGKPSDPAILGFFKYILSEGQNIVNNSGLCQLNNVYLKYASDNLK